MAEAILARPCHHCHAELSSTKEEEEREEMASSQFRESLGLGPRSQVSQTGSLNTVGV